MATVRKTISVTDQQNDWIKAQIERGDFANESEVIRALIRTAQSRDAELESLREALRVGEESGVSDRTVDEIWQAAKERAATT